MTSDHNESEWHFSRVPGGYESRCPDLGITISADEIKRKADELTALLCVRSTMIGLRTVEDDILKTGTLNFYATTSRVTWAKSLVRACPGEAQSLDWDTFLERFVNQVIKAERVGEPLVDLADVELTDNPQYLLPNLIVAEDPTIWFGDGGSMKSYLAIAACAAISTGSTRYLGVAPTQRMNVGYVDWEFNPQAHRRRLGRISNGTIPSVKYIRCDRPLTYEVSRLQRLIREHRLGFLVLDSIVVSCDGPAENSDTVGRYLQAVRQLGVPTLLIAHVTKADDGDRKPLGCYASDTEVLTQRGWLLHQDMTLDDFVACYDPTSETLRWARPSVIHEYDYSGDMVRFRGDAIDMLVTPNHRMVVKPAYELPKGTIRPQKNPRSWHFKEASKLSASPWHIPYATPFDDTPYAEHSETPFPTFLGWWLSEGSLNDFAPTLCQHEGELADRMISTVRDLGFDVKVWRGKAKARPHEQTMMLLRMRKATNLGRWLIANAGDHAPNKHIPEIAWRWDEDCRRALFLALMEGDGHNRGDGVWTYTTVSTRLADDVQRLAISLGYSAHIKRRPPSGKGRYDQLNVLIGSRRTLAIRSKRQKSVEPYNGKVYCLTVPTGAYVTRRNGQAGIAGNSVMWHNAARLTWFFKKAGEVGDQVTVGLFNRKNSEDRIHDPMGFTFTFDRERDITSITSASVSEMTDDPALAERMPMDTRIAALLQDGPQTMVTIAEALGKTVQNVSTTVRRKEGSLYTRITGDDGVTRIALIPTGTDG